MFWCCCVRLHRHQLHLASYGCVSFSLILTGIVFTVFAVFQKDSQIGKVWLAGPVLIVVGSVLCGKVMIDWGPAMERGRAGSVDSRLVDEFGYSNLLSAGGAKSRLIGSPEIAHQLKVPVKNRPSTGLSSTTSPAYAHQIRNDASPSLSNSAGHFGFDCITYSPEVPASPFKSLEMREMADKTTQAKEGCEKCAFLHSILDRRKINDQFKGPKVIGKFVFSELNGGPSNQPNYGSLLNESTHRPTQNHTNNDNKAGKIGWRKLYSQGETLIMNERSFLI